MSGSIPTATSVQHPPAGRKQRRFIAGISTVTGIVLRGARQQRSAVNEADQMKSVQGVPAGTGALDAQRSVYQTMRPGEHLDV